MSKEMTSSEGISIFFGMKIGEQQWIEKFRKGSVCFSPIEDFIRQGETTSNNEQGDKYEGVFAKLRRGDPRILQMKTQLGDDLETIDVGEVILLRRKSCRSIPVFCMYGFYKSDGEILEVKELENGQYALRFQFIPSDKMYNGFLNNDSSNQSKVHSGLCFSVGHLEKSIKQKLDINSVMYIAKTVEYDFDIEDDLDFFVEPTSDYPELWHKSKRLSYQKEIRFILPKIHQFEKYIVSVEPLSDRSAGEFRGGCKYICDVIGHRTI